MVKVLPPKTLVAVVVFLVCLVMVKVVTKMVKVHRPRSLVVLSCSLVSVQLML